MPNRCGVPVSPGRHQIHDTLPTGNCQLQNKESNLQLQLLEELLKLLIDELVDLLRELVGLAAESRGLADNLAGDDLKVSLNGLLELGNGVKDDIRGRLLGDLVGGSIVSTLLDNGSEVGASATVPDEQVGGVSRDVSQGADGGDSKQVRLELGGGDGSNRVLGVGIGLQRQVVGQETADVGRGHGGTRDGVDGSVAADPGGLDVQARGEDVSALAVVGEVGTAVINGGGTDGDGVGSSSGRVVASISVVVAGGNSKVQTSVDSGVDGSIERSGLATAQGHVGNRALEALALALLGSSNLLNVALSSELDAGNDVGHGTRAVRLEHLDGVNIGLLGDTVLLAGNGTRAVSTVAVAVDILITLGDGLAPVGTAVEIDVVDVGAGVNNVGINTLTTLLGVQVLVEGTEVQGLAVGDTGQTPGGALLGLGGARLGDLDLLVLHRVDDSVPVDVLNLEEECHVSQCYSVCKCSTVHAAA